MHAPTQLWADGVPVRSPSFTSSTTQGFSRSRFTATGVCGPFPPAPKGPSMLHLHVYLSLPFLRIGSESVGGGERKLKGW